jgi:hypothetical protein
VAATARATLRTTPWKRRNSVSSMSSIQLSTCRFGATRQYPSCTGWPARNAQTRQGPSGTRRPYCSKSKVTRAG